MVPANLHGVWAKWERALNQLETLDKEVLAFGKEPHAWTIDTRVDLQTGRYVFRLDPAWEPALVYRWGAILGEIVHDLRSALDQLVWQFLTYSRRERRRSSSFPIRSQEPAQGFAVAMRKTWIDGGNTPRYGPLYGVSNRATAIIERAQPYHGGHCILLGRLHALWNIDKHRHLIPMHMIAAQPSFVLDGATILHRKDRFDGNTYVIEIVVNEERPDAHVDVEPHAPHDIAFSDGRPVIDELKAVIAFVMNEILVPASRIFPDDYGGPATGYHRPS